MAYYRQALVILREVGDRRTEGIALAGLGEGYRTLGRLDSALAYHGRALVIEREIGAHQDEGATLNNLGHVHLDLGRPDSALAYYRQALVILRQVGDRRTEGLALAGLGEVYRTRGLLDSALACHSGALVIFRQIGDHHDESATLNNLGTLYLDRERPDSATSYYSQALVIEREVGDHENEGETLTDLGRAYLDLGRSDSALAYYRRALAILRQVGDRRTEGAAVAGLGSVYLVGRPDSALRYYRLALLVQREVGDSQGEGATLGNLGRAHLDLGRPDSALAYYRRALVLLREVGNRRGEGTLLTRLGDVYRTLARPDSALAHYQRALVIQREVGDRGEEAVTLGSLGGAYVLLGRLDSALTYCRRAVVIMQELGDRRNEGLALISLGEVYRGLGHPDSALASLDRAFAIQREGWDRPFEHVTLHNTGLAYVTLGWLDRAQNALGLALAREREIGDRHGEALTLGTLGVVYSALERPDSALAYSTGALAIAREVGDRRIEAGALANLGALQQSRPGGLPAATAYYDSAAALKAAIAQQAGGEPNRLSFAEQNFGLFESWALAWLARAPEVGANRAALAALVVAERSRAQALLDLVGAMSSQSKAMPREKAENTRGTDVVANIQSLLASLRRTRASALSYLVTEDTLIVWSVRGSGAVQVTRRSVGRARLDTLVAALRASIWADSARRGLGSTEAQARGDLSPEGDPALLRSITVDSLVRQGPDSLLKYMATLLLPVDLSREAPQGAELVIVPHSVLGLVPFAALPSDVPGVPLGVKYALRYAPSFATLGAIEAKGPALGTGPGRRVALRHALVVADPAMPSDPDHPDTRFPPLEQARLEGDWLAHQLGVPLLSDFAASETAVRQRLPQATLVHLATHGRAYNSDALARASFVALAPDSAHPDGLLTVGDLLDEPTLTLHNAELIVLSACQTGLGNLKEAEGTVGLQRAFLARGARSVLVSLWSVREDATRLLMEKFYTYWLDERHPVSKAEALRHAQDDVRVIPRFRAPYFWAGFQLVGAQ